MGVSRMDVLALLIGFVLCSQCGYAAQHANKHAFEVLCSLYKIAEAPVVAPDPALPEGIRKELIKLNMTTADDDWYNLFSGKDPDKWDEEVKKDPFKEWAKVSVTPDWPERYKAWVEAKQGLDADAKADKEFLRPPATRQRAVAHFRIRQIWRSFEKVENERGRLAVDLRARRSEIEKKFAAARFGDEAAAEVTANSFDANAAGDRSQACGGSSGTHKTGKSLANDIACICTGVGNAGGGHNGKLCDGTYDGANQAWSGPGVAAKSGGIATLIAACPTNPRDFKVSAAAIRGNLTRFWAAVGRDVGGTLSATRAYMLGVSATGADCQGAASGGVTDVCINYKANLSPGATGAAPGIPWVIAIEAAAAKLDELASEEKKIHALSARAESLRDAAWAAYEETKLTEASQTATEGSTNVSKTDRPTTVAPGAAGTNEEKSATNIPRFFLPWTLLI